MPPLPTLPVLPPNGQQGPQSASTPARIHVRRYVSNGPSQAWFDLPEPRKGGPWLPHAVYETELGNSLNFAARIRRKNLFTWFVPFASIPASSGSTRTRWRAAGHTGPLLGKIKAMIYMARDIQGALGVTTAATVTIYVTNADESTTYGSGSFTWGNSSVVTSDTPTEMQSGEITISGVPSDTDVFIRVDESQTARLVSCSIYEEGLPIWTGNGYPQSQVSVLGSIFAGRRGDMLQLGTKLWKRGAAHLCNWTSDLQSSPRTVSDGTPINIIDGAASGSGGPRYRIDTRYCRTRSKATVPCVLAAYGQMSGSSDTGEVWLSGVNGGFLGTVSISGTTAKWWTTTIELPADLDDYYIEIVSPDGNETLSVYAVSLYQYAS